MQSQPAPQLAAQRRAHAGALKEPAAPTQATGRQRLSGQPASAGTPATPTQRPQPGTRLRCLHGSLRLQPAPAWRSKQQRLATNHDVAGRSCCLTATSAPYLLAEVVPRDATSNKKLLLWARRAWQFVDCRGLRERKWGDFKKATQRRARGYTLQLLNLRQGACCSLVRGGRGGARRGGRNREEREAVWVGGQ